MLSQNTLRTRLALRLAAASTLAVLAAHPALAVTTEELEAKLQALASQVQALQSEVAALKAQNGTAGSAPREAQVNTGSASSLNTLADAAAPGAVTNEKKVDWFGYGEFNYTRPTDDSSGTSADVGRFVLGTAYRFDDRTRFVSELEIEHAVSSATDAGEVEVEQAWIERQVSSSTYAKLGLFLIPSGMLNESHEPTRYYGVFRNFVKTAIIPSTWRELGIAFEGNTSSGLRWDVGLTTGNDLSKWDAGSSEGIESPLGAIHQEGQLARAGDLSGFLAANYTGVPGLRVGASVVAGDISQGQPGFHANRLVLWDAHARWTPGAWDLSALYARGHISNTADVNLTLVGNPTLIPEDFYGWYAQAAYVATLPNAWTLAPFARFERVNTASGYAFIGTGLTPDPLQAEEVTTVGINLNFSPGVVVKIDYQSFDRDSANDRVNLGLGYEF